MIGKTDLHGSRQHKNTNADGWNKKSTAKQWWTTHRDAGCLADVPQGRNHKLREEDGNRAIQRGFPRRGRQPHPHADQAVDQSLACPHSHHPQARRRRRLQSPQQSPHRDLHRHQDYKLLKNRECRQHSRADQAPRWDLACQHSSRLSLLSSNPGWILYHLGHGRDLSYHRHR